MHIYTLNILEASSKDESFQAHLCTQQFKNLSNVGLQTTLTLIWYFEHSNKLPGPLLNQMGNNNTMTTL
jgi:hypothetical protein